MKAVIEEALTWLDTPYHTMARVKGAGVDCVQFIIAVYENCGLVKHVDTGVYSQEWHLHRSEERYLNGILLYCNEVKVPRIGDIVTFKYGRCVSHAGIYIGDNKLIHAYIDRGVIISNMNDSILLDKKGRSRLKGIYRLKERS